MADDLIQFDGGFLVADLLLDSSVDDSTELTRYPIEDGSLISDHVIRQPRTMSLTLVQTETPLTEVTGFARAVQSISYQERPAAQQSNTVPIRPSEFRPAPLLALGDAVKGLLFGAPPTELKVAGQRSDAALAGKSLKVHVLAAGAPVARVNEFHGQLLGLLESAAPVIVTVKGNPYVDLVIVGVKRTDAAGQVGKATFAVELQQIATVETQTVDLPPVPKSKAPKQAGPKPAVPAKLTTEEKATISLQIVQGVGGFTGAR
jgi:hypothetical protein